MDPQLEWAFKTLGLHPSANLAEVKQAYHDLVTVWHPDRFGQDQRLRAKAEETLKVVNRAHDFIFESFEGGWRYEAPGKAPPSKPVAEPKNETDAHLKSPGHMQPPPKVRPEARGASSPPRDGRSSFAKLVVGLSILGLIFFLIIVGINAISTILDRQRQQEVDRSIQGQLRNVDSSLPLEEQIRAREDRIQSLQSPVAIQDENKALAVLYGRLGRQAMEARDLTSALDALQRASELDPENPLFYDDMGALYAQAAQTLPTSDQRMESWRSAAEEWIAAHRLDPGPRKTLYGERAATALYNSAVAQALVDPMQARNLLYDARRYAPAGSTVATAVEELMQRLAG